MHFEYQTSRYLKGVEEKCISDHALIYRILRQMHFMPNNDFEGNMSHFILIAPTRKILCFKKLHFKFLELQNCIWGARIQDPASFPALEITNNIISEQLDRDPLLARF